MATGIFSWCFAFLIICATVHSSRLHLHDPSFAPDYILRVTSELADVACRSRLTGHVNGSSPGPTLHLQEKKTTWIRVYNDMNGQNLTMHWHGLSQSVAPFSDGTPQASQWPIKAGHFFDYEVRPSVGEAGTYFYHSHVGFQAVEVAGPIVVHEAAGSRPPYQYDHEKTIFFSEYFNQSASVIAGFLTAEKLGWGGDPEAFLVNGKSFAALNNANETQASKPWAPPPDHPISCEPEVFEVEPDKVYRFRAIGGMALSALAFAFEDHDGLEVIAADGSYVQRTKTDRIQLVAGQRFDFLLRTKSTKELLALGNKSFYWMQIESRFRPFNLTSYAAIKYKTQGRENATSAIPPKPTTSPVTIASDIDVVTGWLEGSLIALQPNNFPSAEKVTRTVYLTNAQLLPKGAMAREFWTVNNRTWTDLDEGLNGTAADLNLTAPDVGIPYLVQVYDSGEDAIPDYDTAVAKYGGWDPATNTYPARLNEVIDIVVINQPNNLTGGFDTHPWHFHGGHVYDLGGGPGVYNATENEERIKREGRQPVLRDTVPAYKYTYGDDIGVVPPYTDQGWRAVRLRVADAGIWMIHCHTLQHIVMGMQTVWVMGNASEITQHAEPYVAGYLKYGGSAYGNATYDPLVYHHFE